MHPLELFDRFRRWFSWVLPGRQPWDRNPEQVAPDRSDDWLLEPASLEEARLLFLNWMKSGLCSATSNSAWRYGSGTAGLSECQANWCQPCLTSKGLFSCAGLSVGR